MTYNKLLAIDDDDISFKTTMLFVIVFFFLLEVKDLYFSFSHSIEEILDYCKS